jgi:hypothetical protein
MITWKAISISAIWIGVGIGSLRSKDGAALAFWAMWATVAIALN